MVGVMRLTMQEHKMAFFLEFSPETMEDQITLIRFGKNATKERLIMSVYASEKEITAQVSISKRKQTRQIID